MAVLNAIIARANLHELQPLLQMLTSDDLGRHALIHVVIIISEQYGVVHSFTGLICVQGLIDLRQPIDLCTTTRKASLLPAVISSKYR